jgi:nitrate/nitrite transporter NarK
MIEKKSSSLDSTSSPMRNKKAGAWEFRNNRPALGGDEAGNAGRVNGFLVTGGNLFGVLAPIVTGYVISGTGSYDWAFLVAGALLLVGAITCLTMTRDPISPEIA